MGITKFKAKYLAYEISKRNSSEGFIKLSDALADAQVDLNPHQIEAALFAFKNPLSKGVILADEVGLGKTIEAGIVIAQKWAEEKRKILVIVPANLRKQWQAELEEKFYLPAEILESTKIINPDNGIQIMSYQFASKNADVIKQIQWDCVLIDEAHRLRNVYKENNVIAKSIKNATDHSFKLLLTATPLQNSLLELYGLVSFVDDLTFGDLDSFKFQFLWTKDEESFAYDDLVSRLKQVCIRTLRKQVLEYIKYTKRTALTQEFYPTSEEQVLYDKVSKYLQKSTLMALPNSQRHLISLLLWKLLASSSFAIAGTLKRLAGRLERMLATNTLNGIESVIAEEYSGIIEEENIICMGKVKKLTPKERAEIEKEMKELTDYAALAGSIKKNAKGEALIVAVERGFVKLKELGALKKAVIFTESRRTQEYLFGLLSEKYNIVIFNGGVAGTAEKRAELIENFRNNADIMIATEAAAEGINLQFCSMVINYDLPFNPQRIEQRIGRCHRYGQKHDVVVINFLNKNNIADQRVYELLYEKFLLFDGVFGASDTILGTVEGVDFEKRIIEIYENCRTTTEIEQSFNDLRAELESQISGRMRNTKQKLLENFDTEVSERLRINYDNSTNYLNKHESMLWELTEHFFSEWADFEEKNNVKSFTLRGNPFGQWYSPVKQTYYFDKAANKGNRYRLNSPLARKMLKWIKDDILDNVLYGEGHYREGEITFDLTNHLPKISALEKYKGKSGYLRFYAVKIEGIEEEELLIFTGYTDGGSILGSEHIKRMFELEAVCRDETIVSPGKNNRRLISDETVQKLDKLYEEEKSRSLSAVELRNTGFFDTEIEKLDKWAKDVKHSLEKEIRKLDVSISEAKKQYAKASRLNEKVELQEKIKSLDNRRKELRMKVYSEQDIIDQKRDDLIEQAKKRLEQRVSEKKMFIVRWGII